MRIFSIYYGDKMVGAIRWADGEAVLLGGDAAAEKALATVKADGGVIYRAWASGLSADEVGDVHRVIPLTENNLWLFGDTLPDGYSLLEN